LEPREEDDQPAVMKELEALKDHRHDLYNACVTAIGSGFLATMLRWYVPARALRLVFVNPRRDPMTPVRAVVCAVDHSRTIPAAA
jgi:hypothetical protein